MSGYSFTQPQCAECFDRDNPGRTPIRLVEPEQETCVTCGMPTEHGIYIRIDPQDALHPTLEK